MSRRSASRETRERGREERRGWNIKESKTTSNKKDYCLVLSSFPRSVLQASSKQKKSESERGWLKRKSPFKACLLYTCAGHHRVRFDINQTVDFLTRHMKTIWLRNQIFSWFVCLLNQIGSKDCPRVRRLNDVVSRRPRRSINDVFIDASLDIFLPEGN